MPFEESNFVPSGHSPHDISKTTIHPRSSKQKKNCACHRETDSAHFSSRADHVRAGASAAEAAACVLLRECRRSSLFAIPVVQLVLGLDTRTRLFDAPANGKEWPLRAPQTFVCSAVVRFSLPGVSSVGLFLSRRFHRLSPLASIASTSLSR